MPGGVIDSIGSGAGGGGGIGPGGKNGKQVSMFALLSGQLNRDKAFDMVKVTNVATTPTRTTCASTCSRSSPAGASRPAKPITGGRSRRLRPGRAQLGRLGQDHRPEGQHRDHRRAGDGFLPIYTWPTKIEKSTTTGRSTPAPPSCTPAADHREEAVHGRATPAPEITPGDLRRRPRRQGDRRGAARHDDRAGQQRGQGQGHWELIKGQTTQYDKVKAIREYFSAANGFVYDTGTGADTSGTTSPTSSRTSAGTAPSTPPPSAGCCARRRSRPGSRSASPAAATARARP